MNEYSRIVLFVLGAVALAALFLTSLQFVPAVGQYPGPYGDLLNRVAVYERHVTNVVTAINFDYRGFDTLGEESILFLSVAGTLVLLRHMDMEQTGSDNQDGKSSTENRPSPSSSDATRGFALLIVGPMVVFGLYIATHGQLTPGGGFQGGVIIATAFLLLYIAGDFTRFRDIFSHTVVAIIESLALFAYVGVGLGGLAYGTSFLQNVVPRGNTGDVLSGGTIFILTCVTCLSVAAGFLIVIYAFLEQVLEEWSD